jgi:RNA polymerase-binding transcription factor DksA
MAKKGINALNKEELLEKLRKRRHNRPKKIDNASLPARAPMYYYCKSCGALADKLPESHTVLAKSLCTECQQLKDFGWLEE